MSKRKKSIEEKNSHQVLVSGTPVPIFRFLQHSVWSVLYSICKLCAKLLRQLHLRFRSKDLKKTIKKLNTFSVQRVQIYDF